MKNLPKRVILLLSLCSVCLISCKNNVDPKSVEELITAWPWQVEELRISRGNVIDFYKRGQADNTVNYDGHYNIFTKDGKGFVYGGPAPAPLKWSFIGTDKTKIAISVYFSSETVNLIWENIEISEKSFRYTEYYKQDGYNVLVAGIRTPKP